MTPAYESLRPSLAELQCCKSVGNSVAISKEIFSDLDTPVSAYLKIRSQGPSFLLESVEGGEQLGRYSFLGNRPRRTLRVKDGHMCFDNQESIPCTNPLEAARRLVKGYSPAHSPRGRFEGGVLGYLSYEAATYFERLPKATTDSLCLPDAAFMDVDTLLVFDHVAHTIRIVSHVWLDQPIDEAYAAAASRIAELERLLSAPTSLERAPACVAGPFMSNVGAERFEAMVRQVQHHIMEGDILQAVISHRLTATFESDPFALYRRLRATSPSPFMYFLDFEDHQLVGASPELLLQVEGSRVSTRPIAGTRPRGADAPADIALGTELLEDEKERAEHLMLVDLSRNDVGRIATAGTVEVGQFMSVERFSHVMHLVTDVTGTLRPDLDACHALQSAFPAGTVSGAPKIRAMEIISGLEPDQRGPYAGAVGFINSAGDMEIAITIRTGVIQNGNLHIQAGAGIVADSDPRTEYMETLNKARALLLAAGAQE